MVKGSLAAAFILLAIGAPALATGARALAQAGKGSETEEGPGTIVVVNELDRDVTVWINGELKGMVEAAEEGRFGRIPSGRLRLKAGGAGSGGPVASEERELAPGETFTWTLYPVMTWEEEKGTGTVVLVNALDQEVSVFLGENAAGKLAPGAARAYPRVVAGEVAASARDAGGAVLDERKLTVASGRITRWEIGKVEDAERRPLLK